ncbi:MAG: RluA family pseudouridine synthase [Bacteroidales bacterium]|nr:RluA family pseudouridine synthase [Bacteroidales bacterium]
MIDAGQILYEDNHLLAINKRPGQICQGDKSGDLPLTALVKEFIRQRDNKPGQVYCGLIHRIDRPVSGVVLLAKTSKALTRMIDKVRTRDFEKHYWAVVRTAPPSPEDVLENWLVKREKINKSYCVSNGQPDAKLARLSYRDIAVSEGGYHLLDVNLHTGRHHQIRCQLANIGCPIKGDLKYGAPRPNPDGSISLHARSVTFQHPVRDELVTITAPNPEIEQMFLIQNHQSISVHNGSQSK